MTEQEWLTCKDPQEMLRALPDDFSRRKLRHIICSDIRLGLPPTVGHEVTRILDFAERIADDERNIDADEWIVLDEEVRENCRNGSYVPDGYAGDLRNAIGEDIFEEALWFVDRTPELNERATTLLRCVFGNPFRPALLNPVWLTSDVVALARGIYDERAFDRMPILADALQDAGCDNDDILNHCRTGSSHARGCWVVDMLLGKV